jgi:hypothetical protein
MHKSAVKAERLIGELSFADAILAIEEAEDLLPSRGAIGSHRFARWGATSIGR